MFKVFKTSGIEGNYNISVHPLFVSNNCWAIYPAKHKTTKKVYSVWQFQKKDWEIRLQNEGIINKNNKQMILNDIYDNIKLFIGNQSKLKHPNFLTVIEPLEDHKNRVLFVTEYVVNDLNSINKSEMDEIMITKGLLQVSSGLKFLHESVQSVDLNINPSSIVVTENYDWKICGLTFLENIANGVIEKYIDPIDSRLPSFLNVDFRFSSPNLLLNHKVDYINDLFSLCCIIYFLFNDGEVMLKCPQSSSLSNYERQVNKLNQVLNSAQSHSLNNKHAFFSKIPDNYYTIFIDILQNTQESNTDVIQLKKAITINDMIESNIFNNELIKILNVIDEFTTLQINDKVQFLKNLKPQIHKFPKALLINKFIPILIEAVDLTNLKKFTPEDEELVIESCENLILLSKNLSQLTFSDKIFPFLLILMKKLQFDGYKILLLKNLSTIQNCLNASVDNNSNNDAFQKFTLDLFEKCINKKNSMAVQELTLINVKTILQFQQYTVITKDILPQICTIYSTTTSLKVKNLTILAFVTMISDLPNKSLDDFLIIDKILPLIYNTSSTNYANTKFTSNILKLYNSLFEKLSKSTSKSFNIKGTETEIYDIIMEIGFQIWKIAKFVSNREDLMSVYTTWENVEKFLKKELDVKIPNTDSNVSVTNTKVPNGVSSTISHDTGNNSHTFAASKAATNINSYNPPMKMTPSETGTYGMNNSNNHKNDKNIQQNNRERVNTPVMPASRTMNGNPKSSHHSNELAFGQTSAKAFNNSNSNSSSNSGIDWSSAGTFGVMKPTSTKMDNSNNSRVNISNVYNTMKPTNVTKSMNTTTLANTANNFGVMKPTSTGVKTENLNDNDDDDDDDDGWGDFAVGSTTIKNTWNDSLI